MAYQHTADLPSFTTLGASLLPSTSAAPICTAWAASFARALSSRSVPAVLAHLLPDAYWKDMLALTWDFRAFRGRAKIAQFLADRLELCGVRAFESSDTVPPSVVSFPDMSWVQGSASFDTRWGRCVAVFRLVPTLPEEGGESAWKAFAIYTNLEALHGVVEQAGHHRLVHPPRGSWLAMRERESEFVDAEPAVLIIGGGHNGLMTAARLKYMGVPNLILEKAPRLGSQWRGRYASLCTHDPVWFTQLPYLPFPATWPAYTPADKLGDWLEAYASHLDLNVWLGSETTSVVWSPLEKRWTATVRRADGSVRTLRPRHVVYAAGWNGVPYMPDVPGRAEFEAAGGRVLHSSQYRDAQGFEGKRVIVIGSGVSAHDIAQDLVNHGAQVTLHQRSSTFVVSTHALRLLLEKGSFREGGLPVDTADMLMHSFPIDIQKLLMVRNMALLADVDRDTLQGLERAGFMLNPGPEAAGYLFLVLTRRGGYYFDVGASQMIIDGQIALKTRGEVSHFTPSGLAWSDGITHSADAVIFATGFGAIKDNLAQTFGPAFVQGLKDPWYLDEEGELRAVWRDSGRENFWYMIGNLSYARFYSRRVALQIKALEEGVWDGTRYSIKAPDVPRGLDNEPQDGAGAALSNGLSDEVPHAHPNGIPNGAVKVPNGL